MRRRPSRGGAHRVLTGTFVALLIGAVSVLLPSGPATAEGGAPTSAVQYGDGDAQTTLDVFLPEGGGATRPAIVLVHGGGWTGGARGEMAPDATAVAHAGFVAFSIDYRVSTTPRWPTELEDVQRAVRWVQDHAADYGVDPANIGLLGSSAGGNLAMLVGTGGTGGTGDGRPPVKAVASWSGPSDLTTLAITNIDGATLASPPTVPIPGAETPPGCAGDDACIGILGPNYLQALMDCTLPECPEQYREASPVFHASGGSPPMFLAGAQVDLIPLEQNYEMANALAAEGIVSELFVTPGKEHGETLRDTAMTPTLAFFNRFLVQHADKRRANGSAPATAVGSDTIPAVGPDGRLPVPAIPAAAEPRTGISGFVTRHRSAVVAGAVVVVVVVALLLLFRRRTHAPAVARAGP